MLYADEATKSIYKRVPNDDASKEALEAYQAKRNQQRSVGALAATAKSASDEEEGVYDASFPSINAFLDDGLLKAVDNYPAPTATELYKDPKGIDLSAVTEEYIMVPSIWIHAAIGESGRIVAALIDEGAKANLISQKNAMSLGLPITEGINLEMNGVNSKIDLISVCEKVRIDVFGVVFRFDLMVSRTAGPTLLRRPWGRKTRLNSRNCDDGSWEGTISDIKGRSIVFIGTARPSRCRTIEDIMDPRKLR